MTSIIVGALIGLSIWFIRILVKGHGPSMLAAKITGALFDLGFQTSERQNLVGPAARAAADLPEERKGNHWQIALDVLFNEVNSNNYKNWDPKTRIIISNRVKIIVSKWIEEGKINSQPATQQAEIIYKKLQQDF